MNFDTPTMFLLGAVIGLGAIFAFLLYFLRMLRERPKKFARKEPDLIPDETYNQLITVSAIAEKLRRDGIATETAEALLRDARKAMRIGAHKRALALINQAKKILSEAQIQKEEPKTLPIADIKPPPETPEPSLPTPEPGAEKKPEEESELSQSYLFMKKKPVYLMESQFTIKCAEDAIAAAENSGHDVTQAKEQLKMAKAAFERGNYTEAFKHALRTQRTVQGLKDVVTGIATIPAQPQPVETVSKPSEAKTGCTQCGAPLSNDDNFCRKCGTKIIRKKLCPACNAEAEPEDIFCGKCGSRI